MSRDRGALRAKAAPPAREVSGRQPPAADGPTSLYEWCASTMASKELEDPLAVIRTRLKVMASLLAVRRGEDPWAWSVYVERHVAGLRCIMRDGAGNEVDLQRLPPDPTGLA